MSSPLIRLIIPFTLGMIGANLLIAHINMMALFILCCIVLAISFFLLNTSKTFHDGTFGVIAILLFFLIGMTIYTANEPFRKTPLSARASSQSHLQRKPIRGHSTFNKTTHTLYYI